MALPIPKVAPKERAMRGAVNSLVLEFDALTSDIGNRKRGLDIFSVWLHQHEYGSGRAVRNQRGHGEAQN